MQNPETVEGKSYREIEFSKASPFIRAFAGSPYVSHAKGYEPHIFQNPTDPLDQEMHLYLLVRDPEGKKDTWKKANVSWHYYSHPKDADDFREVMNVMIDIPLSTQNSALIASLDRFSFEFDDVWSNWLDRIRPSGQIYPTIRMHSNAKTVDQGLLYSTASEEDEKSIKLVCEDIWWGKGYDPKTRDGLTIDNYALQIAERMSKAASTIPKFLPIFEREHLPKFIRKLQERIRTKPALWTLQAQKNLKVTELKGYWLEPEEGTEPNEYNTEGEIMLDGEVYRVFTEAVEHNDPKWPGRFKVVMLLPDMIQNKFGYSEKDIKKTIDALSKYVEAHPLRWSILQKSSGAVSLDFTWLLATDQELKNHKLLAHFSIDETMLYTHLSQGHSRAQLLSAIVDLTLQLHRDIKIIRPEQLNKFKLIEP